MSTPTLRWLRIHQYEQFEPVRIDFSSRENLILGLNGAGKSQLLKLIWAVLSLSLEELGESELHVEFELVARAQTASHEVTITGEVKATLSSQAEEPPASGPMRRTTSALEVSLKLSSRSSVFFFKRSGRTAQLLDAQGSVLATDQEPNSRGIAPDEFAWNWTDLAEQQGMPRAIWDAMPGRDCCAFGEADEEFRIMTTELEVKVRQRRGAPELVQIDVEKLARLKSRLLWDLGPTAHRIVTAYTQTTRDEGIALDELKIDPVILTPLGAVELRLIPDIGSEIAGETRYKGIRMRLRFRSGATVRSSELTFGQRRYLYAALVSSTHPDKPVVCDEIDNGMHPRLVLALLEMWSDRQVFVASHNPLVIDSSNFYSPADVREKIHILRRRDDGRQVVKVFDDATAREIHAAIDVKIQSPSAVLESEGLW